MRRSLIVRTLVVLLAAGALGGAGHASATETGIKARLVLPARSMPAGSTMRATIVITNSTGRSVDFIGCGPLVRVLLSETGLDQANGEFACAAHSTVPAGTTRYPVEFTAKYPSCSATPAPGARQCLPDGSAPPLRAGTYYATMIPNPDSQIAAAPATPIRVVQRHA